MGAWALTLFGSDHDLDTIGDLNHEAGLDKLEESNKAEEYSYSICADYCREEKTVKLVREHLDGHVLDDLTAKYMDRMADPVSKKG